MASYHVVALIGGFGVARAPNGEIEDVCEDHVDAKVLAHYLTQGLSSAPKYWIIDGAFVTEPYLGGIQLGELPGFDVGGEQYLQLTQAEFDELCEIFHSENGYYPNS